MIRAYEPLVFLNKVLWNPRYGGGRGWMAWVFSSAETEFFVPWGCCGGGFLEPKPTTGELQIDEENYTPKVAHVQFSQLLQGKSNSIAPNFTFRPMFKGHEKKTSPQKGLNSRKKIGVFVRQVTIWAQLAMIVIKQSTFFSLLLTRRSIRLALVFFFFTLGKVKHLNMNSCFERTWYFHTTHGTIVYFPTLGGVFW